jgi:hypothetical protein
MLLPILRLEQEHDARQYKGQGEHSQERVKRTVRPYDLGVLNFNLLRVKDHFLCRAIDLGADFDDTLIAPRAAELKVKKGDAIVDGLDPVKNILDSDHYIKKSLGQQ